MLCAGIQSRGLRPQILFFGELHRDLLSIYQRSTWGPELLYTKLLADSAVGNIGSTVGKLSKPTVISPQSDRVLLLKATLRSERPQTFGGQMRKTAGYFSALRKLQVSHFERRNQVVQTTRGPLHDTAI